MIKVAGCMVLISVLASSAFGQCPIIARGSACALPFPHGNTALAAQPADHTSTLML